VSLGPGLAAWDLTRSRLAVADAERSAQLDRLCGLTLPAEERAARVEAERRAAISKRAKLNDDRQARSEAKLADVPYWPMWAIPIGTAPEGRCPTCGGGYTSKPRKGASTIRFCGRCQRKLGRHAPRVVLAVRLERERKP